MNYRNSHQEEIESDEPEDQEYFQERLHRRGLNDRQITRRLNRYYRQAFSTVAA